MKWPGAGIFLGKSTPSTKIIFAAVLKNMTRVRNYPDTTILENIAIVGNYPETTILNTLVDQSALKVRLARLVCVIRVVRMVRGWCGWSGWSRS